jgi:hypothetical protein
MECLQVSAIVFGDGTHGVADLGGYPQVCGKTGNSPLPAESERIDYFASALSAANAESCARYVAMKDLNRNGQPFPPLIYREEQNDLRVWRVLSDCALSTIESSASRALPRDTCTASRHMFPIPTFLFSKEQASLR